MLREETPACLELLVEMRLALSSLITVEARVSALEEEALEELEELEDSSLAHDANIKGKNIMVKNSNLKFATSFFVKLSERPKKDRPGVLEVIRIFVIKFRGSFFITKSS